MNIYDKDWNPVDPESLDLEAGYLVPANKANLVKEAYDETIVWDETRNLKLIVHHDAEYTDEECQQYIEYTEQELEAIAEKKRLEELAEQERLAAIAEQERLEKKRLEELAEQERLAAIAEKKRLEELAEQERLAAIAEQEKEYYDAISDYTYKLSSTDYITAKMTEAMAYGDTELLEQYKTKYANVIEQRKVWREKLNELRSEVSVDA